MLLSLQFIIINHSYKGKLMHKSVNSISLHHTAPIQPLYSTQHTARPATCVQVYLTSMASSRPEEVLSCWTESNRAAVSELLLIWAMKSIRATLVSEQRAVCACVCACVCVRVCVHEHVCWMNKRKSITDSTNFPTLFPSHSLSCH